MEGSILVVLGYDCRHILTLLFCVYQIMHIGFTSIEANFHLDFWLEILNSGCNIAPKDSTVDCTFKVGKNPIVSCPHALHSSAQHLDPYIL